MFRSDAIGEHEARLSHHKDEIRRLENELAEWRSSAKCTEHCLTYLRSDTSEKLLPDDRYFHDNFKGVV